MAGKGYDGRLVLKGDLQISFRDGKGASWFVYRQGRRCPVNCAGLACHRWHCGGHDFRYRHEDRCQPGAYPGRRAVRVEVRIPDFEAHEEMLWYAAWPRGRPSEFLRFLEQSPLGEKLDHFTADMKATGNGSLNLELRYSAAPCPRYENAR